MRFLACTVWLLTAYLLCAAEPDRAVVTVMRTSAPDLGPIQVIKRVPVNAELNLVLALGAQDDWATSQGDQIWWGDHRTLGVLLQRRSRPDLIYKIAISKGEGDCGLHLERATAKDVVLLCTPEKGDAALYYKFVYNISSKTLIKQIKYEPFSLERIFVSGQEAVLVGSDTRRPVAMKYVPGKEPLFHLLMGSRARQWTQRIGTGLNRATYMTPEQFKPVRFGAGHRFALVEENDTSNNHSEKRLIVLDRTGNTARRYPLPQSSYNEFARLRPARGGNGYYRGDTTIDELIGSWQIVGGALWFAKTFYDGEGNTGVGGFGYFDTELLKYRIYSPPEIVDWSATAILVQPEIVWLALASYGEYVTTGGGLLRVDRATQKIERIALRDVVNEMALIGDHILLATDFGAAVVTDHTLRRFFVDQTTDGRLEMSESVLSN